MNFPVPKSEDWKGWVYPVPVWRGRTPVVSDGFSRNQTVAHRKHLGLDIMFRRMAGDPIGLPFSSPGFTSQDPPPPILAAFDGQVWAASLSNRGWQVLIDHGRVNDNLGGVTTWYQHLDHFSRTWRKGDKVQAGDVLGVMGHDVAPNAYKLNHLHFQLAFPRPVVSAEDWLCDPAPYMALWRKVPMPPQHLPTTKVP